MKFTNRKNLPEIIVRAVTNDPYTKGDSDYSATQLIKPAHQNRLQEQHADDVVEDVADRLWSIYGSAHHYILEQAADGSDLVEKRFFSTISGKRISAQIDHYKDGIISDWKLTSAYKVKKAITEQDYEDWEQQLNIQAYLMESDGYDVKGLRIGAMVRDWTPYSFKTEQGYPDQIEYIEIPLWPIHERLAFIIKRIEAMESPEPCTRVERWQPDPDFAVMKTGGTRALKVEKSFIDAFMYCEMKRWIETPDQPPTCVEDLNDMLHDGHEIIERTGPNRRCENYCNVKDFCKFYQDTYAKPSDLPFKNA